MRLIVAVLLPLLLSACMGVPFSGGDPETELAAPDGSYRLKLPAGWSVKQRTGGEDGRVSVIAHKDAADSGKGYPTMVVKEIRVPTPQGVLHLMAGDAGLEFSELWGVTPDRYQLRQVRLDGSARVLTCWLSPRDGQGLEYYQAIRLTRFGRIEMTGVAQAGTVQKYAKDFDLMFAALEVSEAAAFSPASAGDTAQSLRAVYARAMGRERDALSRQGSETASWAQGQAVSAQEKGFLGGAYARAMERAMSDAAEMKAAVEKTHAGSERANLSRLAERLDEAATALETIQLNIRDASARASVEKSAQKARRLAQLGREAARLPI